MLLCECERRRFPEMGRISERGCWHRLDCEFECQVGGSLIRGRGRASLDESNEECLHHSHWGVGPQGDRASLVE